ncbi:TPA: hypothetical protein DDW35_01720, partial [Candidatus Sumerlaeota bacterium]|nr:hypothetical protein [Candidatus Sumerlaeota bacterium]
MLLLFFPQITLTIILFLALAGGFHFVRITDREPSRGGWKFLRFWLLPALELFVLLLLMRYPSHPIRFPQPGWRCAFQGFGMLGVFLGISALFVWGIWVFRMHVGVDWRGAVRWGIRFAAVWCLAGMLAAPQLLITGELIRSSNQARLAYTQDEEFFTGAQAYGSARDFIQSSALAKPKEVVNNMALGPVVWGLLAVGIGLGCHRRRRMAFYALFFIALIFAVYMAAPGAFDTFRRLPFFSKFSGLSRYLAFLNFFLILFAFFAIAEVLRKTPKVLKTGATVFMVILILGNLGLLLKHQVGFWHYLKTAQTSEPISPLVPPALLERLQPGERMLVDMRERGDYVPLFMMALQYRIPAIGGYGPIRNGAYDDWMRAHNQYLGVMRDDYRAGYFEPVPTVWTRALGVRWFVFPPGAVPDSARWSSALPHYVEQKIGQWTLVEDCNIPPVSWPETALDVTTPTLSIPLGWRADLVQHECNALSIALHNPKVATWAVFSLPAYNGWEAWCDGTRLETARAYGFLFAAKVPAGKSLIVLRYRPKSFILGWVVSLAAIWLCVALVRRGWRGKESRLVWSIWGIVGIVLLGGAGVCVWWMPDYLVLRLGELIAIALAGGGFFSLP